MRSQILLPQLMRWNQLLMKQQWTTTNMEVAQRSIQFGQAVADAIYEWSKTDGGHEGYLHPF